MQPAFDASTTPSPQTGISLGPGGLHLHDTAGRQEHVGLLLGEVSQAFEGDRFVQALGAFREAVNVSRGVPFLEKQVLQKCVKEATWLASPNWRIAASLISEAAHLDEERLVFLEVWKAIQASQEAESATKTPLDEVELELSGNEEAEPEVAGQKEDGSETDDKEVQNLERMPTVANLASPIHQAELPSRKKIEGRSLYKLDWRALQVPLSATVTLIMIAVTLWAIRHVQFEGGTVRALHRRLPVRRSEATDGAAASRGAEGGGPRPKASPVPTRIPRAPFIPPTRVESPEVMLPVPVRNPQPDEVSFPSSEQRDWDRLGVAAGIDALRYFILKYPRSMHAGTAAAEVQRLEWQKVDQGDPVSLEAFVSTYRDTPYAQQARERLEDLKRIKRAQAEQTAWNEVDKNSVTAVQSFLANYPTGVYQETARSVMADLDRTAQALKSEVADESAWKSVRAIEQSSIESYLAQFPTGKHRGPAVEALADLRQTQRSNAAEAAIILSVLARLTNAWNAKDIDSIMALQANLDRRSIKSQLLAAKTISIRISPISVPEISDAQATVECRRVTDEVFSDGAEKMEPESLVTYVLTKRNGAWIVAEAR